MSNVEFACAACGVTGVRLYRDYGGFLRRERIFCNAHVPKESFGWYVPLRVDPKDGSVWGHCAGDQASIDAFYALADADENGPVWEGSQLQAGTA